MATIRGFRELKTYQKAKLEARRVFVVTRGFPVDERYSLTDQIRRSSRAVGAMIAEAWARRRYAAVFVNKLSEAAGEAVETQVWLDHALDAGYLKTDDHADMDAAWREIDTMLQGMIDKADTFCAKQER